MVQRSRFRAVSLWFLQVLECAFAKFTVAKAGSGFLSHAQCKSSFLWFCLTTGYPILWFITIFSWPGNLGLNTLFSAPNGHVLDRYTSPKSSQARMKMRTQRGAHIYGIEHDGANTRPSMMGFWARLFFSGTSFLWTFHDICMNIYKEKKMMNIFKRPHWRKWWTSSNGPIEENDEHLQTAPLKKMMNIFKRPHWRKWWKGMENGHGHLQS